MKRLLILIFSLLNFLNVRCLYAQETVDLWVTKNFQEEILNKKIPIQDESVMKILQDNCTLQRSFAGAFVNQINGVPADLGLEKNSNWFYYINGLMADEGALGYFPKGNDVVWWDFHRWNDTVYVSAVVGAYPQPFKGGYNGKIFKTVLVSTDDLFESAEGLKASLQSQGVKDVEIKNFTQNFYSDEEAQILIGSWEKIQNHSKIKDIVENCRKSGFFIRFKDSKLMALDIEGKEKVALAEASAILAIGAGFQVNAPFWIITGTDVTEVKKAVQLLIDHPERIQFYAGVVLNHGEIIPVPAF